MKDVAHLAGVSPTTVSLVLNGRAAELRISEKSVQAVHAAARELHYTGNYHARMLARGSTATLGFAYDLQRLPVRWTMAFQRGVTRCAVEQDYGVLHVGLKPDQSIAEQIETILDQKRVDGMILLQTAPDRPLRDREGVALPVVGIMPDQPTLPVQVFVDEAPAVEAAVGHLREQGHRAVVLFYSGGYRGEISRARVERYRQLCASFGLDCEELVVPGTEVLIESAGDLVRLYHRGLAKLKWKPPRGVTGVLAVNDFHAAAMGFHLMEQGYRIPRDLSIIGCDGKGGGLSAR